jgi:hypothetical protein
MIFSLTWQRLYEGVIVVRKRDPVSVRNTYVEWVV